MKLTDSLCYCGAFQLDAAIANESALSYSSLPPDHEVLVSFLLHILFELLKVFEIMDFSWPQL
jgi:hypothetical protein